MPVQCGLSSAFDRQSNCQESSRRLRACILQGPAENVRPLVYHVASNQTEIRRAVVQDIEQSILAR